MSTALKGKVALVTGSTSGIGLGIALAFAEQGARVMLNGFGDVDAALTAVRQHDPGARHHGADMAKPADIEDMVKSCEREFGRVDVLVNNAGIQHVAPVHELSTPSAAARASTCFCTSGVSTQPGHTALTVTPVVAFSSAATFVSPTTPCLAAT